MDSILRICVSLTLLVVIQHIEVLTVRLDVTSDISKQPKFHNRVHNPLKIESI